jgi:hypothetical protein
MNPVKKMGFKDYPRMLGPKTDIFSDNRERWKCPCGKVNDADDDECARCGAVHHTNKENHERDKW